MSIILKKFWYKIFDKPKYQNLKNLKNIEKDKKIFKEKFETYIEDIQKKIKHNKELSFLHSGHCGDVVCSLPVIKELSKTHKCNLYVQSNKPLLVNYYKHPSEGVYISDRMLNIFLPVLKQQDFLQKAEKYKAQEIDINLDIFRELPVNIIFDQARWFFHVTGIQTDLTEKYLNVPDHESIKKKIVIHRSFRYRNYFINYKFLKDYKNLLFIGTKDEYNDLKKEVENLEFYDCKNFLEMAKIIKSSKFFIGNSSVGYDFAEGLKVPRLLEACPNFPVKRPHGKNAYDFYYQIHFEKFFKILNELTN